MIEKIRKELAFKYTVIIACILFFGFAASYTAYRHHGLGLMQDSLFDYLTEELWEAGEATRKGVREPTIHKINSDIMSLHNLLSGSLIKKSFMPSGRRMILLPKGWSSVWRGKTISPEKFIMRT